MALGPRTRSEVVADEETFALPVLPGDHPGHHLRSHIRGDPPEPRLVETVFNVDLDQGQGWAEWMIVGWLLIATLALCALARQEWLRAALAAA